ncbi:uncharacterized protein LOC131430973 [Malaya genurostris]|uniref:uncharacterized protein LOC131430973 n=1 Tax=Malaya genurostris TaxID=325434 RepID=UPI0026F39C64|nr:uncharacterized protein LOC131430973 [Malaya genurostris]
MEDDVLEACLNDGFMLMLLNAEEEWKPADVIEIPIDSNACHSSATVSKQDTADNELDVLRYQSVEYLNSSTSVLSAESDVVKKIDEMFIPESFENDESEVPILPSDMTIEYTQMSQVTVPNYPLKELVPDSLKLAKFEVNFSKIPEDLFAIFEGSQTNAIKVSETDYNRLVDNLVGQVRTISCKIPFSVFRRVAINVSSKYKILMDVDDDGEIIGDGSGSLADKLRNHNTYLNRSHRTGRSALKEKFGQNQYRQCRVGVVEKYYSCGEPYCSKEDLIVLHRNEAYGETFLRQTESYIRFKIDNSNLPNLIENLPFIKQITVLKYHFERATGINPTRFIENYLSKRKRLIQVSRTYIDKKLHINDTATDLEIFVGVSKILKEDFSTVLISFDNDATVLDTTTSSPILALVGRNMYYVHTEGTIVTEGVDNIVEAVLNFLMFFFVYFYKYPASVSKTLEFFQLYLLKLKPDKGTRSVATIVGKQQRQVRTLLIKLAKIQ